MRRLKPGRTGRLESVLGHGRVFASEGNSNTHEVMRRGVEPPGIPPLDPKLDDPRAVCLPIESHH